MDILTSNKLAFAYTVKTLGKSIDYEPFFNNLDKFNIKVEYKIKEKDSLGKNHYHGIFYLDKGFYRKRLIIKGFHIKLEQIYDKAGWIKYIHKDCEFHTLELMTNEKDNQGTKLIKPVGVTVKQDPNSPSMKFNKSLF